MSLCRCTHTATAHHHYRPGADCALCPCSRFRHPGVLTRLLARLGY